MDLTNPYGWDEQKEFQFWMDYVVLKEYYTEDTVYMYNIDTNTLELGEITVIDEEKTNMLIDIHRVYFNTFTSLDEKRQVIEDFKKAYPDENIDFERYEIKP